MLLYKSMKKINLRLNFAKIWIFFSLLTLSGSLVYVFYALDTLGLIASIFIALCLSWALIKNLKENPSLQENRDNKGSLTFYIYFTLAIVFNLLALIVLFERQSDLALISPWQQLNHWFFILISLSSFFVLLSFNQAGSNIYKRILFIIYLISIFSVAAIIYLMGYGFDPHIHYAAMTEISRFGSILPKTPYYLGQYSLVIFFHKIFNLNLQLINTWLVPISVALSLPFLLSYLHHKRRQINSAWTASLLLILLGFSPFIVTTPQNLSYLFLIATVIFIYKKSAWPLPLVSALASFCIHPLAGIPALLIVGANLLDNIKSNNKFINFLLQPANIFLIFITILSLAIWSIAGFSAPQLNNLAINFSLPIFENSNNYALNLAYFLINNQIWLIISLLVIMIFYRKKIWQQRSQEEKKSALLLTIAASATLVTYLISLNFSFPKLIAYEQSGYTNRLLNIFLIISLPLFWELFYFLAKRVSKLKTGQKIFITMGLSLLLLSSVYGSYPRFDNYHNSRGYSTGKNDLLAVIMAEELAKQEKYIVLANQQVSAAALKEFGFKNRYLNINNEETYFYPVPTGGKLYQYFLDLSYKKADRATMLKAMDFAQVDRAYLIVNKYWWASEKIIAEAKMSADSWYKIGEGENYLFEYLK
jgi:hypothetical protein